MLAIYGYFVQAMGGMLNLSNEDGSRPTVCQGLVPFAYMGVFLYPGLEKEEVGFMIDKQGESKLHDLVLTADRLSFRKQYIRHELLGPQASFLYTFDKLEEGMWVGTWRNLELQGDPEGEARCIVSDEYGKLAEVDVLALGLHLAKHDLQIEPMHAV